MCVIEHLKRFQRFIRRKKFIDYNWFFYRFLIFSFLLYNIILLCTTHIFVYYVIRMIFYPFIRGRKPLPSTYSSIGGERVFQKKPDLCFFRVVHTESAFNPRMQIFRSQPSYDERLPIWRPDISAMARRSSSDRASTSASTIRPTRKSARRRRPR